MGGEDPLPECGLGPLQRRPDPDGECLPATGAAVGQSGHPAIPETQTLPRPILFGKKGGQQVNRIQIGDVALGHRAGHRKAGTRPRSREHTPTEASWPSGSGPVGVESGLSAGSPIAMARGNPDPSRLPRPLRGVISPTVGQALVVELHPIPHGP